MEVSHVDRGSWIMLADRFLKDINFSFLLMQKKQNQMDLSKIPSGFYPGSYIGHYFGKRWEARRKTQLLTPGWRS